MGVPALFRWLSKKYPKIISQVQEELPAEIEQEDGTKVKVPVDATKPNPNGEEMDNLYLDMNGIVHPCSHPEDRPPPANEEEMMIAIFEYTDRVVKMVRPRKLLMIAVDGVAPRAKMNQQRSRRFRSAQEAAEKDAAAAEYHAMMLAKGGSQAGENGDPAEKPKKTWDSNSITPGTPFMDLLAASLRYWVQYKLNTDPAWEKLKIIISDATVPGEGEHKIMNFVRSQRSSPTHDPNTRHVIYGLDADLIMLGIATHEPHFRVLREDVFFNDTKPGHCRKCNQPGHIAENCRGESKPKPGEEAIEKPLKPFIWLHVSVLREYLAVELEVPGQNQAGVKFNLERALDDWVFMCFFVGNDFLPHLPSLDIREDGIDTLIAIWRDNLIAMGGYVTKDGHVDLKRAQMILDGLALQEHAIFKRRREAELRKEANDKRREEQKRRESNKRQRMSNDGSSFGYAGYDETVIRRGPKGGIIRGEQAPDINALPMFAPAEAQTRNDPRYANGASITHADIVGTANRANKSAAAALKEQMMAKKSGDNQDGAQPVLGKRTRDMIDEAGDEVTSDPSTPGRNTPNREIADPITNGSGRGSSGALGGNSEEAMPEDTVKLWEEGYEGRYYEQKFHVSPDDIEFRHKVASAYVEGLCWVLLYYFQGCPSWTWYYPYHYAPFAADFKDLDKQVVSFDKGKPFRPYEQLMGVMPAASNHTIPSVFHPLMTNDDSPIKEFYPTEFEIDLNGKKFSWQGVALLPFIDEKKLLDAMAEKYPMLSADEIRRNAFGNEALIFSSRHPLYEEVAMNFYSKKQGAPKYKLNAQISEGLHGKISKEESYNPNSGLSFPLEGSTNEVYTSLEQDESVTVVYHMPSLPGVHKSMLLPGVKVGKPVLDYNDIQQTRDRAGKTGRSHGGVQLSQNGDRSDGRRINYQSREPQNGHGYQNGGGGYGNRREYPPSNGAGQGYSGQYQPPPQQFSNIPPHVIQQAAAMGFPPPPNMPMPSSGWQQYQPPPPPPPPPQHQQNGGYGGYGGRDGRGYDGRRDGGYGGGRNGGGYGYDGYGQGGGRRY